VLFREHARGPELRAGAERAYPGVAVPADRARGQKRVQAPVDAERDRVPAAGGLRDGVAEHQIREHLAAREPERRRVQGTPVRDGHRHGQG
jgi:hypothetical protein